MMVVLDAHCDAPSQMLRLRDFALDNAFAQVDFPKMVRGQVDASFFAAYVPASLEGEAATAYARRLLDEVDRQVAANAGRVAYARCADGVRRNRKAGMTSVLLGIENASALQESFELLREFHKRGVRYVTLTHSADNQVGDSCTGKGTWGGLSPFGKRLIPEMNRRRMMIDVAHASDDTIRDVLELSEKPIAYTHGACRALASHRRNLPDELIRGIAERGGVVCISIYPPFLDDGFVRTLAASGLEEKLSVEDAFIRDPGDARKRKAWEEVQRELQSLPRPGVGRVVDHIEHAVSVAGIEHVGIGTDYDGIEVTVRGLEDISSFPLIWDEMRSRGFSRSEVERVAGKNLLRVLKEVRK
ncbi:MAG: dipeptidase [Bacteroidales bacterium]|nr:dipeptidase [Bacteroidales bacterium]